MDKIIISSVIAKLATELVSIIFKEYRDKGCKSSRKKDIATTAWLLVEQKLSFHLSEIESWSQKTQLMAMSSAVDIQDNTIGLKFNTEPQQLLGAETTSTIDENSFLTSNKHTILLGAPGSGKTTTFKRLVRKILTEEPEDGDEFKVPLLIRLGTLDERNLHQILCDEIGIRYIKKDGTTFIKIEDDLTLEHNRIENILPAILDEIGAILLLDGLDEVPTEYRRPLEQEIEKISFKLNKAKFLISCRAGEYNTKIGYFDVIEVCPLSKYEVDQLAQVWLKQKYPMFIKELHSKIYFELASRPLFLAIVMVLFDKKGYLPSIPRDIYEMIVLLAIENWDQERGIQRTSQYSEFLPKRKKEFLENLSYELTYQTRKTRFTTDLLVQVYETIYHKFHLPKGEARQVAKEIESHTGIIAQAGYKHYEFSHLTLQEYLCAEYLAKKPLIPEAVNRYLKKYPSPLAIATSISTDPNLFISLIILHKRNYKLANIENLSVFISRILIEKPGFYKDVYLGMCAVYMLFLAYEDRDISKNEQFINIIYKFISIPTVHESLIEALVLYKVDQCANDEDFYTLEATRDLDNEYYIQTPLSGCIAKSIFNELLKGSDLTLDFLRDNV